MWCLVALLLSCFSLGRLPPERTVAAASVEYSCPQPSLSLASIIRLPISGFAVSSFFKRFWQGPRENTNVSRRIYIHADNVARWRDGSAAASLLSALEFSADDGIHDLDEVGQPIRDFDIVASEFQYVCVIS